MTNNVANPQTKSAVCDLRHIELDNFVVTIALSQGRLVNLLILVVDDEPDVEMLFRQHSVVIFAWVALRWTLPNPAT